MGQEGLSDIDRDYLAFGDAFEEKLISQATARTLEDSMTIGWEILGLLAETELTRHLRLGVDFHQHLQPQRCGKRVKLRKAILREDQTVEQMIAHLQRVRQSVWAPISTAEPWHIWLKHPELVAEVDFIAVHVLPYWEGVDVEYAVDHVLRRHQEL